MLRSAVSRFECDCGAAEGASAGAGEGEEVGTDARGRSRETVKHIGGYGAGRGALVVFQMLLAAEPTNNFTLYLNR